ncbi:hypothetical protein FOQG_10466 [Fusarium oxysporum f. sp. raphani 54005]|uniref:Uncharacterized protein n=11 Tax=Fusarium oxysporum TaxID=5507 RepID=A0A420QI77_FUSOX|nr:hypothetical protein FOXG_20645 [Fusarium oxysporum f. sp. lycopersici 4287]EWZ33826.1 hypothetical protein FOZG_13519 [Fusarium oxysporum Fo47]EWZ83132.1 hypothetical protein FOWG_13064 [Fusarium oxysporum f. sp. lycopersici MN25]EXA34485.1 hypothetical protein FOVG_14464 [Fusarium oxysporum f. sp. pisi HDV247]EXK24404.1 hypothetical protein FOMG_18856 [Fusarium oxysporum f. sp. melonis 26406]EXK85674.1 hypothetical protein FOQG_10466 [Fusarium oxysporum f. sp. raphani 54005]EXL42655.1 hy
MSDNTENPKEDTEDMSIKANEEAKEYLSYLEAEVQRLKYEEERDQLISELTERNEFLEKEIQRLKEQIKNSSDGKEQETKK